jgi:ATP-dependent Clp protease ATP-binding subunit ClpA
LIARQLQKSFEFALTEAVKRRHEYVTLEHLLYALLHDREVVDVLHACGGDVAMLKKQLDDFLNRTFEQLPDDAGDVQPVLTAMLQRVVQYAQLHAQSSGQKEVDTPQMLAAIYQAERSQAVSRTASPRTRGACRSRPSSAARKRRRPSSRAIR